MITVNQFKFKLMQLLVDWTMRDFSNRL